MIDNFFFFFNDTATTEIYTLSLHDALPISRIVSSIIKRGSSSSLPAEGSDLDTSKLLFTSRSEEHTLNSSHANISYAVFCLKKKKKIPRTINYNYIAYCIHKDCGWTSYSII